MPSSHPGKGWEKKEREGWERKKGGRDGVPQYFGM